MTSYQSKACKNSKRKMRIYDVEKVKMTNKDWPNKNSDRYLECLDSQIAAQTNQRSNYSGYPYGRFILVPSCRGNIQYHNYYNPKMIFCEEMGSYIPVIDSFEACNNFEDPRKPNNNEKFSFSRRFNGIFNMSIFPSTYPFFGFNEGDVNEIWTLLDAVSTVNFRMRIQYLIEENMTIKARCLDLYTANRLRDVALSWFFRLPTGTLKPIKVLFTESMPKIFSQNHINTSRSKIDFKGYTSDGYKVIFNADPICAYKIFKKRFNLKIRDQNVPFRVLNNPYARLFR
ncbi:uncharacterized protein [Chironomus tepperi]|uniref:uncharacterized protein isoform X2 n=1 Tax=Chironomus tepperi TaxID=113505 RepID=UPI00391FC560